MKDHRSLSNAGHTHTNYSHGSNFKVPLTPSFVQDKWDADAYQWKSGESIVIFAPRENKMCKRPLNSDITSSVFYTTLT